MDVKINGVLISSYTCGSIGQNVPKRVTITGSYTAVGAGPHTIEIENYRNIAQTDCFNYFDNILLQPTNADLFIDEPNVSIQSGRIMNIDLDAGPSHAGETYFLLASYSSYPGFTVDGIHMPLVMDGLFSYSRNAANGSTFQNTFAALDAQGTARARFVTIGPLDPGLLGTHIYFAYALLTGTGQRPVTYASVPAIVNFIP